MRKRTSDRLERVERQVSETPNHKTMNYSVSKASEMEERAGSLENKSRLNNMRVFNIPERPEGNHVIAFLVSADKAQTRPDR